MTPTAKELTAMTRRLLTIAIWGTIAILFALAFGLALAQSQPEGTPHAGATTAPMFPDRNEAVRMGWIAGGHYCWSDCGVDD